MHRSTYSLFRTREILLDYSLYRSLYSQKQGCGREQSLIILIYAVGEIKRKGKFLGHKFFSSEAEAARLEMGAGQNHRELARTETPLAFRRKFLGKNHCSSNLSVSSQAAFQRWLWEKQNIISLPIKNHKFSTDNFCHTMPAVVPELLTLYILQPLTASLPPPLLSGICASQVPVTLFSQLVQRV